MRAAFFAAVPSVSHLIRRSVVSGAQRVWRELSLRFGGVVPRGHSGSAHNKYVDITALGTRGGARSRRAPSHSGSVAREECVLCGAPRETGAPGAPGRPPPPLAGAAPPPPPPPPPHRVPCRPRKTSRRPRHGPAGHQAPMGPPLGRGGTVAASRRRCPSVATRPLDATPPRPKAPIRHTPQLV
ncbi:unnamed protein product, partial [Iphiclides podalirius]